VYQHLYILRIFLTIKLFNIISSNFSSERGSDQLFRKTVKIFLLCICLVSYGLFIEPNVLLTKHYTFPHKLNHDLTIKIVQISDTHLSHKKDIDQLRKIVTKVNKMKPDFIVFTGDLISDIRKFSYQTEVLSLLKEMKATRGKLAVYGNHDHGGYFTEQYEALLKSSEFILLKNEEKSFYVQNEKISFIGLDDYMLGDKKYTKILNSIQKDSFTIVLAHEPDIATITRNFPINLQLSGHSHGGQLYIPFFQSFLMPPYAKKYNRGVYHLSEQFERYLVVSNGLGTTKLPFRFLTPPEIVSIEIKRAN